MTGTAQETDGSRNDLDNIGSDHDVTPA